MVVRFTWLLSLLLLLAGSAIADSAAAQDGGDITIYRCTDGKGRLALQDSPCAKDQSQQTRQMLQPSDPPPRPASEPARPSTPPAQPAPPPRVVVVRTPQPLYECVRPDNSTYTSDNDEGNPRWQSIWSIYDDMPRFDAPGIVYNRIAPHSTTRNSPGGNDVAGAGNGSRPLRFIAPGTPPSMPPPRPRPPHPGHGHGQFGGGGMWVRDDCHALPQVEVCARLRDRREEIRRRRFNAQQVERETLAIEERGINARLSADCGGS